MKPYRHHGIARAGRATACTSRSALLRGHVIPACRKPHVSGLRRGHAAGVAITTLVLAVFFCLCHETGMARTSARHVDAQSDSIPPGDLEQQFGDADRMLRAGFYDGAFQLLESAAEQGHPGAQYALGVMYEKGLHGETNVQRALELYTRAAAENHARAATRAGLIHFSGLRSKPNHKESVRWFRRAAKLGDPVAFDSLGYMYQSGRGVLRDYATANSWFNKGAALSNASAQANLGYAHMNGLGVDTNYTESLKWTRLSADQNHPLGLVVLGLHYEFGHGILRDYGRARHFYYRAIKPRTNDPLSVRLTRSGAAVAYLNLGRMAHQGIDVVPNARRAAEYFRYAAELGNAEAQHRLARLYMDAQGVEQDYVEAIYWLLRAAHQGSRKSLMVMQGLSRSGPAGPAKREHFAAAYERLKREREQK